MSVESQHLYKTISIKRFEIFSRIIGSVIQIITIIRATKQHLFRIEFSSSSESHFAIEIHLKLDVNRFDGPSCLTFLLIFTWVSASQTLIFEYPADQGPFLRKKFKKT